MPMHPKPTRNEPPADPVRRPPLPLPGESQAGRVRDILLEDVAPWISICVMLVLVAALEWLRYLFNVPPQPTALTLVAGAAVAYFAFRKRPALRALIRRHRLGATGERHVAEVLDWLRADGYHAIHDLAGDGFNIDHVLVGPTGVYVIETKYRSKRPGRRDVRVTYDGERVLVDGRAPDRDPLRQARALAAHVRRMLAEPGRPPPPIRPVVLFPGWWVERQPPGVEVWVLNARQFPRWVRRESPRLPPSEVCRISSVIEGCARRAD